MKHYHYEIRVESYLESNWADWFDGLIIHHDANGESTLSGLMDQAALHSVLTKIRDLGLTLVAVQRIDGR